MKITEVEALYLRLPQIQARTDSSQDALIVKVTTDAGIVGWGEVDGCPHVVKAIVEAPTSHTLVTGLRQLLLGEDPLEISRLWHKMYQGTLYYGREGAVIQAMAGIDLALWDIKGKALNAPLYELFGGKAREHLELYATLGVPPGMIPQEELRQMSLTERARATMEAGYRVYRVDGAIRPTPPGGPSARPRRWACGCAPSPRSGRGAPGSPPAPRAPSSPRPASSRDPRCRAAPKRAPPGPRSSAPAAPRSRSGGPLRG